MNYYVEIQDAETGEVEKRMGPFSFHKADKVADGVCENLDHERYFVAIVPEKVEGEGV